MAVQTNFDLIVARSRVIDRKQWGEMSGLSDAVIRRLDQSGVGPSLVRLSPHRVGYRIGDCLDWLEARKDGRDGPVAMRPSNDASVPSARTLEPAAASRNDKEAIEHGAVGGEAFRSVPDERGQRGGRAIGCAAYKGRSRGGVARSVGR